MIDQLLDQDTVEIINIESDDESVENIEQLTDCTLYFIIIDKKIYNLEMAEMQKHTSCAPLV